MFIASDYYLHKLSLRDGFFFDMILFMHSTALFYLTCFCSCILQNCCFNHSTMYRVPCMTILSFLQAYWTCMDRVIVHYQFWIFWFASTYFWAKSFAAMKLQTPCPCSSRSRSVYSEIITKMGSIANHHFWKQPARIPWESGWMCQIAPLVLWISILQQSASSSKIWINMVKRTFGSSELWY